jgi:hypothetical protein
VVYPLRVASDPEHVLLVGQDRRGRWLVQDDAGLIEGRFISRETAIGFARAEQAALHASIVLAQAPVVGRLFH